LLLDLKEIEESKTGRAAQFSRDGTALLRAALVLKAEKLKLDPALFAQRAKNLETQLDALISRQRQLKDPDKAIGYLVKVDVGRVTPRPTPTIYPIGTENPGGPELYQSKRNESTLFLGGTALTISFA
jgi:hypothetical protein